jgi:hypothetical protein
MKINETRFPLALADVKDATQSHASSQPNP